MIWCVEDDPGIRDIEVYALTSTGFEAKGFAEGAAFWDALQHERPELVILDVMLPGIDGLELLRRMKESDAFCHIPVIMATAKGTEYDKVQGLDIGADDYLVKPFGMMEMVSRVKAVLRRCNSTAKSNILKVEGVVLDSESRTLTVDDQPVQLTYKEYELLRLFLSHPNQVFSRDRLYESVWGMDLVVETRTVDMHIRTLRHKLGAYAGLIETVRNVGYILRCGA